MITPLHSNAIIQTWALYDGSINYNGALPVSGATGTYKVEIFNYYHSFSLFGRSANVVASLPYALGSFQGTALGAEQHLYRSGLLDSVYSLLGKPQGWPSNAGTKIYEMAPEDLAGRQSQGDCPGQYDPTKLINWGANRWGFKPEFGYSQRWAKWVLDGYMGVWLFTTKQRLLVA